MPVLDASAILNAFPFEFKETVFTVPGVVEELKDFRSRTIAEQGIESGKLVVSYPSEVSVKKVRGVSKTLGLSDVDVSVLALALDKNMLVLSDDRGIQKAARNLGIKYRNVMHKPL